MIRKLLQLATWSLIAALAAGCGLLGLSSTTPSSEKERIEETLRILAAAGEQEDIETLMAHVAEAIVAEIAKQDAAEGASGGRLYGAAAGSQDDVFALVQGFMDEAEVERVALDPTSVQLSGNTAVARGQFLIVYSTKEQSGAQCSGTAEAAFVKDGSRWVVSRVTVLASNCSADGEAAPAALSLMAAPPKHYFDVLGYFVLGANHPQVKAIQESLNYLGYNAGLVDGYYGPKTVSAVKAFQKAAGLYVDGEFGPKTAAALDKALSAKGGYFRFGTAMTDPGAPAAGPTTLTVSALRKGTIYETAVYTYQSANPGPTLIFIGCIHGNEQSGRHALIEAIDRGITVSRGRVVIVPEFNRRACEANRRTLTSDYNRMFPVGKTPTSNIAKEMWSLVKSQPNLAMVVDFHDGFINSLGNSLIHTRQAKAGSVARNVRDRLNALRPAGSTGPKWRAMTEPISGSLTRKVGRDLGIPAMEVELSGRNPGDPLSLRKQYAWEVIKAVGEEFGIQIAF